MKKNDNQTVCVIGLGYVGLPLAVICAEKGYRVYGLESDQKKISLINKGHSPIHEEFLRGRLKKGSVTATADPGVIKKSDVVLICVPTPVDNQYYPDLGPVKEATAAVVNNLKKGSLIVVESTINPGVCEEVVEPLFSKGGFKVGRDYHLAHCPERINPGDPKWNVTNIPRVVGSFDKAGLKKAVDFYRSILESEIHPMKSIREAEAVKVVENSFRDINIAFVNELAKSFDKLDIDVTDVIRGASTKPFSFMAHWPSCGVGGHCIPVDPYYLIERAKMAGFDHKFLKIAREINNSMPEYSVELLQDLLNDLKLSMNGTAIGVLGLSYKANVADLRESPSLKIIRLLEKHRAKVLTFDPYLPEKSTEKNLDSLLRKSAAVILATDHREFKELDPKQLKKNKIRAVVDGKNAWDMREIKKLGILYTGIGR